MEELFLQAVSPEAVSWLTEGVSAARVDVLGWQYQAEQGMCPVVWLLREVKAELVQEVTWPEPVVI